MAMINKAKGKVFQALAAAAVAPFQCASGGDRGAETMHKTAQLDLDARPEAVLHSFDVSNAHDEY